MFSDLMSPWTIPCSCSPSVLEAVIWARTLNPVNKLIGNGVKLGSEKSGEAGGFYQSVQIERQEFHNNTTSRVVQGETRRDLYKPSSFLIL